MAEPVPSLDELVEVGAKTVIEMWPRRYGITEGDARIYARAILTAVLPRVVGAAVEALDNAIGEWAYGAEYKGEYLKAKHGDEDGIAAARTVSDQLRALGGG